MPWAPGRVRAFPARLHNGVRLSTVRCNRPDRRPPQLRRRLGEPALQSVPRPRLYPWCGRGYVRCNRRGLCLHQRGRNQRDGSRCRKVRWLHRFPGNGSCSREPGINELNPHPGRRRPQHFLSQCPQRRDTECKVRPAYANTRLLSSSRKTVSR